MEKKISNSEIEKRILSMQIKEKDAISDKSEILYNYPPNWGKREISGLEGKGFRGKCRRILMNHSERIILFYQKKRNEDLKEEIGKFIKFYKEFYRINSFEISSISQKKSSSEDFIKIGDALYIMRKFPELIFPEKIEKENAEEKKRIAKEKKEEKKRIKEELKKKEENAEIKEELKNEDSNS